MGRQLHFEHRGRPYRAEIDDYGDSESSDTVTVYGPEDTELASYDTCVSDDAAVIAAAKHQIDA